MEKAKELVNEFRARQKKEIIAEAENKTTEEEGGEEEGDIAEKIFNGLYTVLTKHKKAGIAEGVAYCKKQLAQAKILAAKKKLDYDDIVSYLNEAIDVVAEDDAPDVEALMAAEVNKKI